MIIANPGYHNPVKFLHDHSVTHSLHSCSLIKGNLFYVETNSDPNVQRTVVSLRSIVLNTIMFMHMDLKSSKVYLYNFSSLAHQSMLPALWYQGWTLNFESTHHSGEWPSKCTRPHQFSLAKKVYAYPPPPPKLPVLANFNFYYVIDFVL